MSVDDRLNSPTCICDIPGSSCSGCSVYFGREDHLVAMSCGSRPLILLAAPRRGMILPTPREEVSATVLTGSERPNFPTLEYPSMIPFLQPLNGSPLVSISALQTAGKDSGQGLDHKGGEFATEYIGNAYLRVLKEIIQSGDLLSVVLKKDGDGVSTAVASDVHVVCLHAVGLRVILIYYSIDQQEQQRTQIGADLVCERDGRCCTLVTHKTPSCFRSLSNRLSPEDCLSSSQDCHYHLVDAQYHGSSEVLMSCNCVRLYQGLSYIWSHISYI
ncbi:hypothetical protein J6590_015913 [Homalodisca vitripennis]|nr:hypothetical protein J6590_015913 [Homalodisca vitripennis]